MTACIVGWAHSRFGRHPQATLESLICEVTIAALTDAGIQAADIDAIFVSTLNGGFVQQQFPSSLVLQADPAFRFTPSTHVENACASGTTAIYRAIDTIDAKRARLVLVVGAEKMTGLANKDAAEVLVKSSYVAEEGDTPAGFAGLFGHIAKLYFERYGDQSDALARIAAKNHFNGSTNPYAHLRADLGYDFCRTLSERNPIVSGPLKRTDCSMISDGAAAVVLADLETALVMDKAITFRSAVQVNDFLPMSRRDVVAFEGPQLAWKRALAESKLGLKDLSLVETHDCFTIAELVEYEAMGLAAPGCGADIALSGFAERTGTLPINPSGGLKSKGHPIGATGVSMHAISAMQLNGTADGFQVPGASIAGVFNMGGAAVASCVSILERLR